MINADIEDQRLQHCQHLHHQCWWCWTNKKFSILIKYALVKPPKRLTFTASSALTFFDINLVNIYSPAYVDIVVVYSIVYRKVSNSYKICFSEVFLWPKWSTFTASSMSTFILLFTLMLTLWTLQHSQKSSQSQTIALVKKTNFCVCEQNGLVNTNPFFHRYDQYKKPLICL
jgi:hypothetical protein